MGFADAAVGAAAIPSKNHKKNVPAGTPPRLLPEALHNSYGRGPRRCAFVWFLGGSKPPRALGKSGRGWFTKPQQGQRPGPPQLLCEALLNSSGWLLAVWFLRGFWEGVAPPPPKNHAKAQRPGSPPLGVARGFTWIVLAAVACAAAAAAAAISAWDGFLLPAACCFVHPADTAVGAAVPLSKNHLKHNGQPPLGCRAKLCATAMERLAVALLFGLGWFRAPPSLG